MFYLWKVGNTKIPRALLEYSARSLYNNRLSARTAVLYGILARLVTMLSGIKLLMRGVVHYFVVQHNVTAAFQEKLHRGA